MLFIVCVCLCVCQELSNREKMVEKMETSLECYQCKFAVVRHQQGLMYQEYAEEKKVGCNKHQQ